MCDCRNDKCQDCIHCGLWHGYKYLGKICLLSEDEQMSDFSCFEFGDWCLTIEGINHINSMKMEIK